MNQTKEQRWDDLTAKAETYRSQHSQLNLTIEQARVKLLTPEFYREYNAAKSVPKAEKPTPDPWQGRTAEHAIYSQIQERAAKLRERRPELTREQAFVEIWSENPALRQDYRRAQLTDASETETAAVEQQQVQKMVTAAEYQEIVARAERICGVKSSNLAGAAQTQTVSAVATKQTHEEIKSAKVDRFGWTINDDPIDARSVAKPYIDPSWKYHGVDGKHKVYVETFSDGRQWIHKIAA
jgi:hypothetical protein